MLSEEIEGFACPPEFYRKNSKGLGEIAKKRNCLFITDNQFVTCKVFRFFDLFQIGIIMATEMLNSAFKSSIVIRSSLPRNINVNFKTDHSTSLKQVEETQFF